jgi:hypothetical protein
MNPTKTTMPRTPRKSAAKTAPSDLTPPVRARRAPSARTTRKKPAAASTTANPQAPSVEAVRFRAYEIYLNRTTAGDALSDWLQAEQELWAKAG